MIHHLFRLTFPTASNAGCQFESHSNKQDSKNLIKALVIAKGPKSLQRNRKKVKHLGKETAQGMGGVERGQICDQSEERETEAQQ